MRSKEEIYLAMLEGTATEAERASIERSDKTGAEFSAYRGVEKLCHLLGAEEVGLDVGFADDVLAAIDSERGVEEQGTEELSVADAFFFEHGKHMLVAMSSLASVLAMALMMLVLRPPAFQSLDYKSSTRYVDLHVLSSNKQLLSNESFVHVSLKLDEDSEEIGVAHFLPIRSSKTLSSEHHGLQRITLETSAEIAESIRRAKSIGQLRVTPILQQASQKQSKPKVALRDPYGRTVVEDFPILTNAVLYLRQEQGGVRTRHVLEGGKWRAMDETELLAF